MLFKTAIIGRSVATARSTTLIKYLILNNLKSIQLLLDCLLLARIDQSKHANTQKGGEYIK